MKLPVIKLHYVLVYGTLGALMPYLPIYAGQVGLTERQIGWVLGVFGVAVLCTPPVYTLLADRWLANRTLILASYAISTVALLGMLCVDTFTGLFAAHLLFSLGFTSLIPLLDGLTFTVLRTAPEEGTPPVGYQSIRLYGSYGWMLPGFLFAGLWLARGADPQRISVIAIATAAILAAVGFVGAMGLPRRGPVRQPQRSALPTLAALRTLRRPPLAGFLIGLFFTFTPVAMYFVMYPRYLKLLEIDGEFIGLITNLGVVVEIGFFLALRPLLRVMGLRGVMLLGAVCTVTRLLLMAAVPTPFVAIATQVFHGPMIMAMYLLPPMFLDQHAEPAHRNSVQGLYVMFCFGVARIVGAGSCGHIAEAFGSDMTGIVGVFYVGAGLAAITLFWYALNLRGQRIELAGESGAI